MLSFGPLSFAAPAALLALALLPAIWWLLRVTPPTPLRLMFPPVRLLLRLVARQDSVQRTPPWLLLLRLLLAALLIFAAARPLVDAADPLPGTGPLVLIVDTGWGAAPRWTQVEASLNDLIDRAERDDRPVILVATAVLDPDDAGTRPTEPAVMAASTARSAAAVLKPVPWPPDRASAVDAVLALPAVRDAPPGAIQWLSDGLSYGVDDDMAALVARLRPFGTVTVMVPALAGSALVVRPPIRTGSTWNVDVERAGGPERTFWLRAVDDQGRLLAREAFAYAAAETRATAVLDLPHDLAQRIARLDVEDHAGGAAVALLDDRWRRRAVGIVSATGDATAEALPLLGPGYYVDRALEPFATVHHGDLPALFKRDVAVMILLDAAVSRSDRDRLADWIDAGGVLLRFAGATLANDRAEVDGDPLLPVRLRPGDRTLGGALAWREPARLAPFADDGLFAGLPVPEDVEVRRQVLAEPTLDLDARTLARLDDGTPLITGVRRGDGHVVLVHTTADPGWSNLALSGLFVDILERITTLSQGRATVASGAPLRPLETLDGHGRLGPAPAAARSIDPAAFAETVPGPDHPPGFYGRGDTRQALNLGATATSPRPLGDLPADVERARYADTGEVSLAPWLLVAALVLLIVDLAVSLLMRGVLRRPGWRVATVAVVLGVAAGTGLPATAVAQEVIADGSAVTDALETRLAWVRTGDPQVDAVSAAGLTGLSAVVVRRTAAELSPPVGVDPERDELAFYPLLYWPIGVATPAPSERAAVALRTYLRTGGTILFDTRDRGSGRRGGNELGALASALDLPPLTAIPEDHVLGRSYYLLSAFPGRWIGGRVWVERHVSPGHDGVTTVVAGDHDWAGAWAVDNRRRPMFAVVPGGERQREMAYRFGINLVMHVLTGNYKADQVHLPAILERLDR